MGNIIHLLDPRKDTLQDSMEDIILSGVNGRSARQWHGNRQILLAHCTASYFNAEMVCLSKQNPRATPSPNESREQADGDIFLSQEEAFKDSED